MSGKYLEDFPTVATELRSLGAPNVEVIVADLAHRVRRAGEHAAVAAVPAGHDHDRPCRRCRRLLRAEALVVPGVINKIQLQSLRISPRPWVVKIARALFAS